MDHRLNEDEGTIVTDRTHDAPALRSDPVSERLSEGLSDAEREPTVAWLEDEFPGWTVEIDRTATWEGDLKSLWIARREGHHPQAEMTASKLHTRLTEYLEREERRQAYSN